MGMVAALLYVGHSVVGTLLWDGYNPISMRLAELTADGAPNQTPVRLMAVGYGIAFVLFSLSMMLVSFKLFHRLLRTGTTILFVMSLVSLVGFSLFPQDSDTTQTTFQDSLHNNVQLLVTIICLVAIYLIAIGYLEEEKSRKLGVFCVVMAVLVAAFGIFHVFAAAQHWNILGITERLSNYAFQTLNFVISYVYTFKMDVDQRLLEKRHKEELPDEQTWAAG